MNHLLILIFAAIILHVASQAQEITNVRFRQEGDRVAISYDLKSDGPECIEVYVSTDGGSIFEGPLIYLTGDAGDQVAPGESKTVWWDVIKERKLLYSNNVVFKVAKAFLPMVFVRGGSFMMGSNEGASDEKPVHRVTLDDFWIGKYEVNQQQWNAVMGNNPSEFKGCDDCPVERVSWSDVQEFIRKLNQKTGQSYRLPTEAEWEYAARGGTPAVSSTVLDYSGSNSIDEVAWYHDNSGNKTHPVGGRKANALDIYDMSGNVWEWCSDWYDNGYYAKSPERNPQGPSSGVGRVFRGGSWGDDAGGCRVAVRNDCLPVYRRHYFGFRLVRDRD